MSSDTVCIQCGQPAGDPLRLNHMPNGKACSACRDRLLDSLPAPFPSAVVREPRPQIMGPTDSKRQENEPAMDVAYESPTHLRALPPTEPPPLSMEDDGGYTPSA